MEIVVLDGYTLNPGDLSWSGFEELGSVTVYEESAPGEVADRIGTAEIALTNKTGITAEIIEECPNLKYIGVMATGYNAVDVSYAAKKGIVVTNIPTYGTASVAQHTIALLLEICSCITPHINNVKTGKWTSATYYRYWEPRLIELSGKTMGIIGYGRIGRQTGKIATALGMNVLAYDTEVLMPPEDGASFSALSALLSNSDVISLHCPLLQSTKGMINKEMISKMKTGVILLNTARGPLVNEEALAEALVSGKVFAAGLDVSENEPIEPDNPLLKLPNCIITPHIAWSPTASRIRLMDSAVKNLASYLGGRPVNVVK